MNCNVAVCHCRLVQQCNGMIDSMRNRHRKRVKHYAEPGHRHESAIDSIQENPETKRELNTYIAAKLLPLFEATPAAWQSLRCLNLGPAEENLSFK